MLFCSFTLGAAIRRRSSRLHRKRSRANRDCVVVACSALRRICGHRQVAALRQHSATSDGTITQILVKSGDHVRAGQLLMTIDPLKQQAMVNQQRSTEAQKKAIARLQPERIGAPEAGSSKRAWPASRPTSWPCRPTRIPRRIGNRPSLRRVTQQRELAYYNLTAPFAGVVGDIPVHLGDYVSPQTLLTTVDENNDLEAYIYIPTELAAEYSHGTSRADCHQQRGADRDHEDLFRLAAGGQRHAGHSGEGADSCSLDKFPQFATGESARGVEHRSSADCSGSGGHAHWRAVFCLCRWRKQTMGTVAKQRAVNSGRYRRQ